MAGLTSWQLWDAEQVSVCVKWGRLQRRLLRPLGSVLPIGPVLLCSGVCLHTCAPVSWSLSVENCSSGSARPCD